MWQELTKALWKSKVSKTHQHHSSCIPIKLKFWFACDWEAKFPTFVSLSHIFLKNQKQYKQKPIIKALSLDTLQNPSYKSLLWTHYKTHHKNPCFEHIAKRENRMHEAPGTHQLICKHTRKIEIKTQKIKTLRFRELTQDCTQVTHSACLAFHRNSHCQRCQTCFSPQTQNWGHWDWSVSHSVVV